VENFVEINNLRDGQKLPSAWQPCPKLGIARRKADEGPTWPEGPVKPYNLL